MNDSHKKMSIATTKQAYELARDVDHLNKLSHDYDAYIVEWPEYLDYGLKFTDPDDFEYPSHRVEFHGYESCLILTEYPFNDVSWPIISKRMLDTLLSVKEFPHRTWDIPFIGFSDNVPAEILEKELSDGMRHDNEFVAVQLLEQLDIFDWENSVYTMSEALPGTISRVRKLVLKEIEGGYPPIFRIKTKSVPLYVSPEGRAALEATNIKGVRFV
jgi:hypothetical protein